MRTKTTYVVKRVYYPILQNGDRLSCIEGKADTLEKAKKIATDILPWAMADDSQKIEYFNSQLVTHYEIEKLKVEDNRYCENCSHWVRTGMSQRGECRRYSPLDRFGNIDVKSYFPEVLQSEWCGEWNIKDEV